MRFCFYATALLFVSLPSSTHAHAASAGFVDNHYYGSVSVTALRPDGSLLVSEKGKASASFTLTDQQGLSVNLTGTIDKDGDNGLTFQLTRSDTGWKREVENQNFHISTVGKITGEERTPESITNWTGTADADGVQLETRIEFIGNTSSAPEPGTVFSFTYKLLPEIRNPHLESTSPANSTIGSDHKCSRIEWRLQAVPNIWGGAMDMISVPHCVP